MLMQLIAEVPGMRCEFRLTRDVRGGVAVIVAEVRVNRVWQPATDIRAEARSWIELAAEVDFIIREAAKISPSLDPEYRGGYNLPAVQQTLNRAIRAMRLD